MPIRLASSLAASAPDTKRAVAHASACAASSAIAVTRTRSVVLGRPVTGSMTFDGVQGDRDAPEVAHLGRLAGFADDDVVFLAGSTQDPEEQLAAEAYLAIRARHPRLRLVIVPRHVERVAEIGRMLDELGLAWQRRSTLTEAAAEAPPQVLLVDTTGELGWWWGTAVIAFVGGSLDGKRGGQNMLEPAAYGAAVSFGPQTRNFRDEVRRLLDARAAVVVADGAELVAFVSRCLVDPAWATELGRRAAELVFSQRGATNATARLILGRLPAPTGAAAGPRIG